MRNHVEAERMSSRNVGSMHSHGDKEASLWTCHGRTAVIRGSSCRMFNVSLDFQQMPCYRDSATELCKEPVGSRKLDCGHRYSVICGEASNDQNVKCEKRVEKRLPCGHAVTRKCHEAGDDSVCHRRRELRLACGHTVSTKCSAALDAKCEKKVKRELPCRHVIQVVCGSAEAAKKRKNVFCR